MGKYNESDGDKHARDFAKRDESKRVASWREDGVWVIVLSNGGRFFCTYVGVPVDHPIAGFDYDSLPLDCHGGLTFASEGEEGYRPEGYYWYGWDYGHSGDFCYYGKDDKFPHDSDEQDWTLKEIVEDAWSPVYNFIKLRDLAEKIDKKSGDSTK